MCDPRDINTDPKHTLKLAVTESTIWAGTLATLTQRVAQSNELEVFELPSISGRLCYRWITERKEKNSGQG